MTQTNAGWLILIAAFGMMATLIGTEIAGLPDWEPVYTPSFVGKTAIHLGAVIAAFVGGKLLPQAGQK